VDQLRDIIRPGVLMPTQRSFNQVQQQSQLVKKGEGAAHKKGVQRIVKILRARKWFVYPSDPLWVAWQIGLSETTKNKDDYFYHQWDIFAKKRHQSSGLTSKVIIEIDGKIHDSSQQQARDKKAQLFAEFFIEDVVFKRIKLRIVLDKKSTDDEIYHKELKLK
jgi:hypothetical protein